MPWGPVNLVLTEHVWTPPLEILHARWALLILPTPPCSVLFLVVNSTARPGQSAVCRRVHVYLMATMPGRCSSIYGLQELCGHCQTMSASTAI